MKKFYAMLLLLAALNITNGYSQSDFNYWSETNPATISRTEKSKELPSHYRTLFLDLNKLKQSLANAPVENSPRSETNSTVISLPMPDGSFQNFKVEETFVMHPELSKKIAYIKTYAATSLTNSAITARLDYTVWGFHAMIMSTDGFSFIDPINLGDDQNYICYYKKDARHTESFVCEFDDLNQNVNDEINQTIDHSLLERSNGTQLRTYRLALACTGEYAAYYGGTKAGAFSGMVTSVNRVTGVYQREVSIKLVLVPNDTLLVYTNASTDPYTNNNGGTMLGQNITTCNSVIGSANYDVGHVFSTGGGGVAYLGVPCGSNKAGGVTGLSAPIGDNFDIDYVAHEMGHEFGGNHTFNSQTGSCGGGNRAASAAYEPGSGTTIMAYAGICGTDNTQPHSDPFFHTKSFDEIVIYTTSGTGNSCPVITATGNTAPVVNPGANYTIPYQTPFILTGSATDVNADTLTYLWEQYDLGPASTITAPSGDAPIFRSFPPSSSPSRTFPKMSDIVTNVTTAGELLPTYARVMHFRLTARDNRNTGGGVTHNDTAVVVTVINTAAPFIVTQPNTAITWFIGTTDTVKWNVVGTNASPINCTNVNIKLSLDGGYTYPITLVANTPNDGIEAITVPTNVSTTARVKVEAVGNIFFDISNTNFSIQYPSGTLASITTLDPTSLAICAGSTFTLNYTINGPANSGNIFNAYLSDASGSFASATLIGSVTSSNATSVSVTIPGATVTGAAYRIRVTSSTPVVTGTANPTNISITNFPAAPSSINGLTTVCQGQTAVVYSVATIANATNYLWTVPSGATITNGANTNSITVTYSSTAVSGNVTVTGNNTPCGSGSTSSLAIIVNPLPAAASAISGLLTICQGQQNVPYSTGIIAGVASYLWTLPSGATIATGAGTNAITVNFNSSAASGVISVNGVNGCGNGVSAASLITVGVTPATPFVSASGLTSICDGDSVQLTSSAIPGLTYQWFLNGNSISNANSSNYFAKLQGAYTLTASSATVSAQSFSAAPALAIPDNSCTGAFSSITVAGMPTTYPAVAISVTVNISHTYDGDVVLALQDPYGNVLGLTNQTGSSGNSGDNFTNTIFTDAAATILPTTGAPYTGSYKPLGTTFSNCITTTKTSFASLGAGGIINPNGTWILKAYDRAGSDLGTINNWSISFASINNCSASSSPINVNVTQIPTVYSMTGGGSYCPVSGAGVAVGLDSSQTGISYQLYLNGNPTALTVTGNGNAISFGNQIAVGSYSVVAVNGPCTKSMNGTATVSLNTVFTWYQDADGDGYGNNAVAFSDCSQPTGYVADSTDCNDLVNTIHPNAPEICGNGIDENCNNQIDEGCCNVQLTIAGSSVTCNGLNNGIATVNALNVVTPVIYLWSNGATTSTINNLNPGNYAVTVTDANGCTASISVSISEPDVLSISTNKTNVTCIGAGNGTISNIVAGGVAPYAYLWNDGNTSQNRINLIPNNYTVTATDANGCTVQNTATITEPLALTLTSVKTNVTCNGGSNGKINITVNGGTTPYAFVWSNGTTSEDLVNVVKGTYTVTITDYNGCTKVFTTALTQPTAIAVTSVKTTVLCYGGNNGAINISVSGGKSPYSYLWSNGSTSEDLVNLVKGTYTVTVTDLSGCTKKLAVVISQPTAMVISATTTNESTTGANDGTATATVTGGTSPYSYSWNTVPVQTNQTATGLKAKTYKVTVTDANGCTKSKSIVVNLNVAKGAASTATTQNELTISPNPVNDVAVISISGTISAVAMVVVTDLTGKELIKLPANSTTQINCSALTKGLYFIKLMDADIVVVKKFVVN